MTTSTAASLGVIPLGKLPPFVDALAVAMIDPKDDHAIDQLADQTGMAITPYIVSELRALYYLEKHYGLPRQARFVRQGTRKTTGAMDRRRSQPAGGIVTPPPVRLEPRRKSGNVAVPPTPAPAPPKVGFADACDRIDLAHHRDEIAATLLEFADGRFPALVLFLVRDGNALGWRAFTERPLTKPIAELALPIGGTSSLQCANDDLRPFRGKPPAAAQPTERALWEFLDLAPAAEVAVVGQALGRLALAAQLAIVAPALLVRLALIEPAPREGLVYAHPRGDRFEGAVIDELNELAVRASEAYLRLIRQAKG